MFLGFDADQSLNIAARIRGPNVRFFFPLCPFFPYGYHFKGCVEVVFDFIFIYNFSLSILPDGNHFKEFVEVALILF